MHKWVAAFSIVVGACMLAMWSFFGGTGQIPELHTHPKEILLHLLAEIGTALFLLAAGIGLLRRVAWAREAYLMATGMLLYTTVNSSGYFLQRGEYSMVVLFAFIFGGVICSLISIFRH